jgi:HD superfamily phosphohydrolase YqeK
MKRYFNNDFKRIGHATRVARYAARIGKHAGGNLAVILPAAYLHDIGILEAERKYGRMAAEYHEAEGPALARSILVKLGAKEALIEEVCNIIGRHHHPAPADNINFKVVYDADLLENMDEKQKETPMTPELLAEWIEKSFLTSCGRELAKEVLLG